MKHLFNFLVLCFLSNSISSYAQNSTKNWFFGTNAGLTFTGSVTSVTPNGLLTNSLSSAAISSTSGALAFYTDGVTIYTSQHTVMANGTGLLGNNK